MIHSSFLLSMADNLDCLSQMQETKSVCEVVFQDILITLSSIMGDHSIHPQIFVVNSGGSALGTKCNNKVVVYVVMWFILFIRGRVV